MFVHEHLGRNELQPLADVGRLGEDEYARSSRLGKEL